MLGPLIERNVMDMDRYLSVMEFHPKWREYELLPTEHMKELLATYKPGMEDASEHDRNSVFHWWLRQSPDKDVLVKLVELSFLDSDQAMADDVRKNITQSACFDSEVERLIRGCEHSPDDVARRM